MLHLNSYVTYLSSPLPPPPPVPFILHIKVYFINKEIKNSVNNSSNNNDNNNSNIKNKVIITKM